MKRHLWIALFLAGIVALPLWAVEPCRLIVDLEAEDFSAQLLTEPSLRTLRHSVQLKYDRDLRDLVQLELHLRDYADQLRVFHAIAPRELPEQAAVRWAESKAEQTLREAMAKQLTAQADPIAAVRQWFGMVFDPRPRHIENATDLLALQVLLGRYLLAYIDETIRLVTLPQGPNGEELPFELSEVRAVLMKEAQADVPKLRDHSRGPRTSSLLRERVELLRSSDKIPETVRDFLALQANAEFGFAGQLSWPVAFLDYLDLAQNFLAY